MQVNIEQTPVQVHIKHTPHPGMPDMTALHLEAPSHYKTNVLIECMTARMFAKEPTLHLRAVCRPTCATQFHPQSAKAETDATRTAARPPALPPELTRATPPPRPTDTCIQPSDLEYGCHRRSQARPVVV